MSARISRECSYHARSCHQSDHVIANLLSRRTSEQTITWPRFLTTVIGVARGCSGCKCTPKRIFFWGGWWRWIYGGKLLVHPRGRECTPWEGRSHIFTGRRRVRRVIYGVFHGVRRMETKRSSAFQATVESTHSKNRGYAYEDSSSTLLLFTSSGFSLFSQHNYKTIRHDMQEFLFLRDK